MASGNPLPLSLGWMVSDEHTWTDGFWKDFFAPRQLFDVVEIFQHVLRTIFPESTVKGFCGNPLLTCAR